MNGDTNGATDSEQVIHGALPLSVIRDRISGVELFESVDDKLAARALQAMDPPLAAPLLDALDSDNAANILRELNLKHPSGRHY